MILSDLVPALQPDYGVTAYSVAMRFDETSASFGYQLGVSHEINPTVSLFAGGDDDRHHMHYQSVPSVRRFGESSSAIYPVEVTDEYARSDFATRVGIDYVIGKW